MSFSSSHLFNPSDMGKAKKQQQQQHQKHQEDRQHRTLLKKQNKYQRNGDPELIKFSHQLKLLHLGIKSITGDGNCLFRCFADQLYGNEDLYLSVRHKICEELIKNQDDYAPFLLEYDDDGHGNFLMYVEEMKKDGTWGGNIEIQAFSKSYQINIAIHQLDEPIWYIINYPLHSVLMIHLAYQGEQHYESIRYETDLSSNKPVIPITNLTIISNNSSNNTNSTNTTNPSTNLHPTELAILNAFPNVHTRPSLEIIQETLKDNYYNIDKTIEYLLLLLQNDDNINHTSNTIDTIENEHKSTTDTIKNKEKTTEDPTMLPSKTNETPATIESNNISSLSLSSTTAAIPTVTLTKPIREGPRRNGPCPCGSLKLYRKCCESIDKANKNKQKFTGNSNINTNNNTNTNDNDTNNITVQVMGLQI